MIIRMVIILNKNRFSFCIFGFDRKMPFTKHQLNDQQFIREIRANEFLERVKHEVILHISTHKDSKETEFQANFELGHDLLIERILELTYQEFTGILIEHSTEVGIEDDEHDNTPCIILKLRFNWEMDLNEAFIVYDSSSDDEQS